MNRITQKVINSNLRLLHIITNLPVCTSCGSQKHHRYFHSMNVKSGTKGNFRIHDTLLHLTTPKRGILGGSLSSSNVGCLVDRWTNVFKNRKISEPKESAEYIIAHVQGSKMFHEIDKSSFLTAAQHKKMEELCLRRLDKEPIQYLLGEWDFCDMTLDVRQPVFIPRPETEELVELIQQYLKTRGLENSALTILEVGCGSGAIAIALLKRFQKATCTSIDRSIDACELTTHNAVKQKVKDRLNVVHLELNKDTVEVHPEFTCTERYQLLVSNPPYIPTKDMTKLQPEIDLFEDPCALHGGLDGLDTIIRTLHIASKVLQDKGFLWLEVDSTHPAKVQRLLQDNKELNLHYVQTYQDFNKLERFCQIQKHLPV
ncbi:unnamed protein product [Owenia fusiformis]|uniref:peptide chain release factor N(5)-glutamine methyltransferase n=1 Tax=Owenia fusiformis TaxID=6347 RepID=A0A8J1XX47_OWEFU|nr:unnamed protein product [Owenia fusiformis]